MNLSEGEARALLASTVLVLLAALGRVLLAPPPPKVRSEGLPAVGRADSALAAAESVFTEVERRRQPLGRDERIDPNLADEAELDRLPGVGPVLARAIVRHRQREGPFRSLEELERVPGLGSSKLGRLAPFIGLRASPLEGQAESGREAGAGGTALDLNRAAPEQLQALPGIGPTRARAIVRWREENGRYRNFQDLLEVPGIGPAMVSKLRSLTVIRP